MLPRNNICQTITLGAPWLYCMHAMDFATAHMRTKAQVMSCCKRLTYADGLPCKHHGRQVAVLKHVPLFNAAPTSTHGNAHTVMQTFTGFW
jgi:hypothetical protein